MQGINGKRLEQQLIGITIDVRDPQYQEMLAALRRIREELDPRLDVYHWAHPASQQEWLKRDPLLAGVLDFGKRIQKLPRKDADD